MLLFTEEKTRHETMIRKQFIKINKHGKITLSGKFLYRTFYIAYLTLERIALVQSCPMELQFFPFDNQVRCFRVKGVPVGYKGPRSLAKLDV